MHHRLSQVSARFLLTLSSLALAAGVWPAWADDTGFFGRLFRFGGGSTSPSPENQPTTQPYGRDAGPNGDYAPAGSSSPNVPSPMPGSNYGGLSDGPATPPLSAPTGPSQRINPKPRVSSAVTSADPVLTRFALGRSNDGSQFGMFLQIFADGTVIDSEGVHHVRPADLKPVFDVVQSGELFRLRGHCGAPATDFIEYVHIVVYERRFGRLLANSFSYSGNPQGCDHVVRHVHLALENLQAKLSRQPAVNAAGASSAVPAGISTGLPVQAPSSFMPSPGRVLSPGSNRQPVPAATVPPTTLPPGPVIPLSPLESPR
jgi:hypothetical protein